MINLVRRPLPFFVVAAVVILGGLLSQVVGQDLRWGIEFSSGVTANVAFAQVVEEEKLRGTLASLGYDDAVVQGIGAEGGFFLRIRAEAELESQREALRVALVAAHGELTSFDFNAVSPVVAQETVRNGVIAVLAGIVGILLYVFWAFRQVPRPFRYAVCTVVALLHDVLAVFAVTSLLAKVIPLEVSTMYLAGILTILGYSVNDTIVVFDRLRENLLRGIIRDFASVVNYSLWETLARSLNTTLTTLLVVLALLILGPATTRDFAIVLVIGIISGSYSSIFIAAQLLVAWERRSLGAAAEAPERGASPRGA